MSRSRRSEPMPVKYWSFAGLLLTNWCNARCVSCYVCSGPGGRRRMTVDSALDIWRGLIAANPRGCRVHLSGGEPFGDWPVLLELCRRAQRGQLAPLEKIETNAFWADGEEVVARRVRQLDEAGMGKLSISADPYHQEYVPIERCRLAARVAGDVLGPGRVQVRWRDWLADGFDTDKLTADDRAELFVRYAAGGRDRLNGRAAEDLAGYLNGKPPAAYASSPCAEALLRSRHVHVDPDGLITPGVCAGIVVGRTGADTVAEVWQRLSANHDHMPVVAVLAREGPLALLPEAGQTGFVPRRTYASKCHLCWHVRKHFVARGLYADVLAPAWLYDDRPG